MLILNKRFKGLKLLLLFCFINHSGTAPVRNDLKHVTGTRGGDAILPCHFKAEKIPHIVLSRQSKNIPVCENEECENGRVFREGSCDVIIKDLRLRDSGKYSLRVYHTNDQTETKQLILEYQLHIQDKISVNTGEELKLDLLLTNADKVETNSSGEWTEVWTRGHGVSSDRLTDSDGNLTINAFTSNDTGTYRVLDSEGEILITLTLTESRTDLKVELDTDDIKPYEPEQHTVVYGVLSAGMVAYAVLLICTLMTLVISHHKHLNRKADHDSSSQRIPIQPTVHETLIT